MNRKPEYKPKQIICVGNRFILGDDVGPRVYDLLGHTSLPPKVQLIDGGLMGLDLVSFIEKAHKIILVDSVFGFGQPGEVVILDREVLIKESPIGYGHSGGLGFLLRVLPAILEPPLPDITLVGLERPMDRSVGDNIIKSIARVCLEMVRDDGLKCRCSRYIEE